MALTLITVTMAIANNCKQKKKRLENQKRIFISVFDVLSCIKMYPKMFKKKKERLISVA